MMRFCISLVLFLTTMLAGADPVVIGEMKDVMRNTLRVSSDMDADGTTTVLISLSLVKVGEEHQAGSSEVVSVRLSVDHALELANGVMVAVNKRLEQKPGEKLHVGFKVKTQDSDTFLAIATSPELAQSGGTIMMAGNDNNPELVSYGGFVLLPTNCVEVKKLILQGCGAKGLAILHPPFKCDPKTLKSSQIFVRNRGVNPVKFQASEAFVPIEDLGRVLGEEERLLLSIDEENVVYVSSHPVGKCTGEDQIPLFATLQALGYSISANASTGSIDCTSPAALRLPPPDPAVEMARRENDNSYSGYSYSGGYSSRKTPGTDVHVRSYYRKDGTFVRAHTRSAPHKR